MAVGRRILLPVTNEEAGGVRDCVNDVFTTSQPYYPGTLTVFLDSMALLRGYDFEERPDEQSFRILIDPLKSDRLSKLPRPQDKLWVGYFVQ